MNSFGYLLKRTWINRLKKALKRPVTYIAAVGIIAYACMIFWSFGMMVEDFEATGGKSLATILSVAVLFIMPADVIGYSKRKGLLFKQADVHFMFPAPVNPKHVLLVTAIRNFIITFLFGLAALIFGMLYYDVKLWQMLLVFLIVGVLQNIMEGSMIVICYGNQTLPKRFFQILPVVMYLFMGIMAAVGVYLLFNSNVGVGILTEYLNFPAVQAVPFVGWLIAVLHLILAGPTTVNVVCAICYLAALICLFTYARKMKCTGEYYEDAMSFAEEYEIKMKKAKKGEVAIGGKKKYRRSAEVEYKGVYAKAIFYRQLLEYKKNRLFIFGWNSFLFLGIGVLIAALSVFTDMMDEFGTGKVFVIPAVIAYVLLIFSGYATKWSKELENPYTYLVPDTGIKKLWYATKIEHIRALVDGCLITIPGAVAMGIDPWMTVLTILLYVCLNANKLYLNMLSDALLGKRLGNVGRTLLRTLFQTLAILAAVVMAVVCGLMIGVSAGFVAMILMTLALTFGAVVGASTSFERMETFD